MKLRAKDFETDDERFFVTVTTDRMRLRRHCEDGFTELCSVEEYKQRRKNQARFIIYDAPFVIAYVPSRDYVLAKAESLREAIIKLEQHYCINIPEEAKELLESRILPNMM